MAEEKKKKYNSSTEIFTHLGVIAIIILLNYVLSFFFGRFDLTEDKRYSLSDKTIELLQDDTRLKDRVFFKIYLDGDLPADLRKVRNSIQEMLDEFIIYAGDNIQYEFIDPNGSDDEDFNLQVQNNLSQSGIEFSILDIASSTKRNTEYIWPGGLVEYNGVTMGTIQFFKGGIISDENQLQYIARHAISKLEYNLVSSIRQVTEPKKKTITFLHGHSELNENEAQDVRKDLGEYYILEDIEINGQINALENTDLLIIAQPERRFSEKDKFVIDQYIMKGGPSLWFVDPLNIPRDSLYYTGQTIGMSANLNIEKDMLYKYGVRLNNDVIVDKNCGPLGIEQTGEIVDWYFIPLLEREEHMITSNLNPIRAEYASSIDLVNESDTEVKKTVLLKSSASSRIFKAPARINYGILSKPPDFNDPYMGDYPVAVLLEGSFSSAFENRPISDAFLNSPDYKTKFKSDDTKMVVISDGDMVYNELMDSMWAQDHYIYQYVPISKDKYGLTEKDGTPTNLYDNENFVLNTIDYLLDDHSLIDIRSKTITLRKLDDEKVVEDKEFWKFANIAFPLIALLALAIAQLLIRRKKYTSL